MVSDGTSADFSAGDAQFDLYDFEAVEFTGPAPVPEPATMFLLGSGLVGLAGLKRNFRKK